MKNNKLNKKIIIPMIMGALAIGSLTSPVHADPSSLDNDYQIIVIEKDPATGKYVFRNYWILWYMRRNN